MNEQFLWAEVYRPKTIAECILPTKLKTTLQMFVDKGEIPNLIFDGPPGSGKTTAARALCEQLGRSYLMINGSLSGNIDTLRTEIKNFASSMSLTGGRKYVILDEADYLNPQSTQPALRGFMDEYAINCGFIMTCNYISKIIDPLHSRMAVVDFRIPPNGERTKCAIAFLARAEEILKAEGVEYKKEVIGEMIIKHFGDWRRILNELQRYSVHGKIDSGILVQTDSTLFDELFGILKTKDFKEMRKWAARNVAITPTTLFRLLYDRASTEIAPDKIPALVVTIAEYQYKHAFVADPEINVAACLTEIMSECF